MTYKYATQDLNERCAKAVALSQNVSTKQSIEVAKFIKGKPTKKALDLLEKVSQKTQAVPYTRFNSDVGHKKGMGPGRFPLKTVHVFKKLIKLAVSNAADQALNTNDLTIKNIVVHKGAKTPRYGRQRGREKKNSHIEVVVEEYDRKKNSK